nr:XK-related protein 4-like [Odocoileus virginianus texanus]
MGRYRRPVKKDVEFMKTGRETPSQGKNESSGLPLDTRQHLSSQVPVGNAQNCSFQRHGVKCSRSALEHWVGDGVFRFHRDTGCEDGVLGGKLTGRQERASLGRESPQQQDWHSAPGIRYFHTIYLGIRSRQSGENDRWRFYWKMVYEYADVSMLHLLATFLESAPQLVLQLCIVVQTHSLQALQGFTAAASLVSLAWALASYQKALRDSRDDKKPISYMAVVIQFCWHFFTIAARVITFALFASVFQLYFGIFIVLHWCIMTFWIVHCETEFCITKWEEIVFDMVVGIIYIFSWFNVKEGRTRCRLFIYYFVILLENTALSALWYLYKAPQIADAFAIPALCVVFSSFLTGVVFMLMYYAFFHPNGPRFGQSPSCACEDPSAAFTLPPDVATSTLRSISNNRSVAGDRDQKFTERDGCVPVFQVRPTAPSTPSSRPPRIEESVIKIDLFRNRYPAWERHVLDRSLRKAILAFECSPSPPRLQYKDDALIQERLEYETTL